MTIQDLIDQFEIQGAFCIKRWMEDCNDYEKLAEGHDFDYERWQIDDEHLEAKIVYMYAVDGVLNIEVE